MAFYNKNIDGVAIMSGRGPCATFGAYDPTTGKRNNQCWEPDGVIVNH